MDGKILSIIETTIRLRQRSKEKIKILPDLD